MDYICRFPDHVYRLGIYRPAYLPYNMQGFRRLAL